MKKEDYQKLETENQKLLELFKQWLKAQNLSSKTIRNHLFNAELFINEYLIYHQLVNPIEGISFIEDFMEDFFVRKCMWSNASSVKSTAASLKKFYQCLAHNGKILAKDFDFVKELIKDNMDFWVENVTDYNNFDENEWF